MLNTVLARSGLLAAAGVGWVIVGYPATLLVGRRQPVRQDSDPLPSISVIVCAAGAAGPLERKLTELQEDGYPRHLVTVVVAADGDEELRRAAERGWPGATVVHHPERRGKAAAMSDAFAHASGEVIVLTDADNVLDRGSLGAAARWFADSGIWAVAGRRGESGSAYDAYEDLLRRLESRSGSVAAASGEFLAVRRRHLRSVPAGIVNDDLWILLDLLARGGRVVYEPAAGGTEPALAVADEIERRARIGAGRVLLATELHRLPPRAAWRITNHKFGRLAVPPLGLVALVGLPFARHRLARVLFAAEVLVLALGAAELRGHRPPGRAAGRVAAACGQGLTGAIAGLAGLGRGVLRRQSSTWKQVR